MEAKNFKSLDLAGKWCSMLTLTPWKSKTWSTQVGWSKEPSKSNRRLALSLKAKNAVFSEIVETPSILEPYLLSYLQDMRLSRSVDGKVVLEMPKRNTVLDIKSSLKNYILQVTQNRIDISSGGQFPQFFQLLKGLFEVVGY